MKQSWFVLAFLCKVFLSGIPSKYQPGLASDIWWDQAILYYSTSQYLVCLSKKNIMKEQKQETKALSTSKKASAHGKPQMWETTADEG